MAGEIALGIVCFFLFIGFIVAGLAVLANGMRDEH